MNKVHLRVFAFVIFQKMMFTIVFLPHLALVLESNKSLLTSEKQQWKYFILFYLSVVCKACPTSQTSQTTSQTTLLVRKRRVVIRQCNSLFSQLVLYSVKVSGIWIATAAKGKKKNKILNLTFR